MEIYHTLRPTGINTRDTWYSGYPNFAADCYKNVNEATKSETDYNYNYDTSGVNQTQSVLYTLETYSGGDAISRITLNGYYRTGGVSGARARFRIKTGGTIYEDSFFNPDTSAYTLYSKVYTTNPKTGNPWSAAEVNALAAGDSLQTIVYTDVSNISMSYCCQFWVTVVEVAVESGGNFFLVM